MFYRIKAAGGRRSAVGGYPDLVSVGLFTPIVKLPTTHFGEGEAFA
jgi:hypothetical protein